MDLPLTKTVETALEKPATTIGDLINGIMLAIFTPLLKYNVRKEAEIQNYKQLILNEVSRIPKENLIEPPLNIIGPAIEASKFYIENDEIRGMFAKLIASSMNSETANMAHPAFIEVIKQLSPFDAHNLKLFSSKRNYPIVKYNIADKNNNSVDISNHIFLGNSNCRDFDLLATSLSNLYRSGLLFLTYRRHVMDDSLYSPFTETQLYQNIQAILSLEDDTQKQTLISSFTLVDIKRFSVLAIEKGIVETTPLGINFIKVCLPNSETEVGEPHLNKNSTT